jgi:hypothetical protein
MPTPTYVDDLERRWHRHSTLGYFKNTNETRIIESKCNSK